jgi:hypothetical protein
LEIEERPALWNSALKEYSDKNVRKSMWEEIVQKFGTHLLWHVPRTWDVSNTVELVFCDDEHDGIVKLLSLQPPFCC